MNQTQKRFRSAFLFIMGITICVLLCLLLKDVITGDSPVDDIWITEGDFFIAWFIVTAPLLLEWVMYTCLNYLFFTTPKSIPRTIFKCVLLFLCSGMLAFFLFFVLSKTVL